MKIQLPYGINGLEIELPDSYHSTIITPDYPPALDDPSATLSQALENPVSSPPLHDIVRATDRVGIIINDITRATPSRLIIQAILGELSFLPSENITLFNALGTHRPNTSEELCQMLGNDLVEKYRIIQNNAFDPSTQVQIGTTRRGHEIWLNRAIWECDAKIFTGFIEPHFFAGFSGGGKAIMPGMAGLVTILGNHDADMIGDPNATWGVTRGNPIWEEIHEIARMVEGVFLVNVTLNKDKQITAIFCGDLAEAHAAGCEFVKSKALVPVTEPFDIILTTNSGYPLDINLYQAVKGMSAAAQVVKPGGAIVIAAQCQDGVPQHGLYGQLLNKHHSPQALLDDILAPGNNRQDQWQAQIQAIIQQKAAVYVYSDGLTDEQICAAMLIPCRSIESTLAELILKYGHAARVCILPEGPQTIPYLAK